MPQPTTMRKFAHIRRLIFNLQHFQNEIARIPNALVISAMEPTFMDSDDLKSYIGQLEDFERAQNKLPPLLMEIRNEITMLQRGQRHKFIQTYADQLREVGII